MTTPIEYVYVPVSVEDDPPAVHDRYLVIMEDGSEDMAWYMPETQDWQSHPNDEQPVKWLKRVPITELVGDAVNFAEWITDNQFTRWNNVWKSTKIHYSPDHYTSEELYQIFKSKQ